jgi:D-amino peptidase
MEFSPMKVYISADIEGVACVASVSETDMSSPDYPPFREQMTAEVVAACLGAYDGGAQEIVVKDAHWTGRNLDFHKLFAPQGKRLSLIREWSGHPFSMVEGLDESFDAVVFVGYHSAASRGGNPLAHTVSGSLFSKAELNGVCASEFYLFGLAAATVGVPVAFLSGDKALCDEAKAQVEGLATVATLEGFGHSVRSMLPNEAVAAIRESVKTAIAAKATKPMKVPTSFEFKLEFSKPRDAYKRSFYPGVSMVSDRELLFCANDYLDVLTFLNFAAR